MLKKFQYYSEHVSGHNNKILNFLKYIFGKIWGLYCMILFIIAISILVGVDYIILKVSKQNTLKRILFAHHKIFPRILFALYLIRIKVHGKEKLENKPYVIISNHRSALDILVNCVTFPFSFQFLSKKEVGSLPIFGFMARHACILVDRSSKRSRAKSLIDMQNTITKNKNSILLYPEGTRNRSRDFLSKFKDGAFILAIRTQTPIVCQTLIGTDKRYPPDEAVLLLPGKVEVFWSDPIETKGLTVKDLPFLKEKARQYMIQNSK